MKKIVLILLLVFNYSCGYSPLYLEKENDILINIKEATGDDQLNNYIKNDLKIASNTKSSNIFFLNLDSTLKKIVLTKNATGKATDFSLVFQVKFTIISEQKKELIFKEKFIIKNSDESFKQSNYEKEIKKNFSKIVKDKLIMHLLK